TAKKGPNKRRKIPPASPSPLKATCALTQAAARPARRPRHPPDGTGTRLGGGGDGQSSVSTSISLPCGGMELSGRLVACRCTRRKLTAESTDQQQPKRPRRPTASTSLAASPATDALAA